MTLVPSRDTKRLLEEYTSQYEASLPESLGEIYLSQRGITKEAQAYFRLGFVKDPEPAQRDYSGTVSIPYITSSGDIVGLKYRRLDDAKPKYLSSLGFEARRIFNPLSLAERHRRIYITEGEVDAITLWLVGIPAVAVPGANAWSPSSARALRNRQIVVLADGDDKRGEGYKLGKQIASSIEDTSIVLMRDSDVNKFYLDNGKEELYRYIGWNK